MEKLFNVIIERDSDGWLVASVPSLAGCHTQAKTFDALNSRIMEAIALCAEELEDDIPQFVGVQQVAVELS